MTLLGRLFVRLQRHKLLITNTMTNGSFLAAGDLIVQVMERHYERKSKQVALKEANYSSDNMNEVSKSRGSTVDNNNNSLAENFNNETANIAGGEQIVQSIDWRRTGNFFITGLVFGPVLHGWYHILDRTLPYTGMKSVVKKVLIDQMVACPICIIYFFYATCSLEGKSFEEFRKELKRKFLAAYVIDWSVWPAAQTINFTLVGDRYRVIFVSFISFAHSIFLSFLKNSESKSQELIDFINKKLS